MLGADDQGLGAAEANEFPFGDALLRWRARPPRGAGGAWLGAGPDDELEAFILAAEGQRPPVLGPPEVLAAIAERGKLREATDAVFAALAADSAV